MRVRTDVSFIVVGNVPLRTPVFIAGFSSTIYASFLFLLPLYSFVIVFPYLYVFKPLVATLFHNTVFHSLGSIRCRQKAGK